MGDVYRDYFRALTSRYDMMRGNRQSPFINFRNESDSVEEEAEKPIPVTRYFNGKKMMAEMLMSDGSLILADQYIPGEDGFIIAQWMEPAATLKLEIMNQFLKDSAIQLEEETKARAKARRARRQRARANVGGKGFHGKCFNCLKQGHVAAECGEPRSKGTERRLHIHP